MTVPIDVSAALIFAASCVVGYAVYRRTRATSTALPKAGDLGVAFGAGLVTLTALSFLFGVTTERQATPPDRTPSVVKNGSGIEIGTPSVVENGSGIEIGTPSGKPSQPAPSSTS